MQCLSCGAPIQVQAPGGGNNPEFNAMFAQNLGFGPPPQQQQHNLAAGTFDMGGGQQLKLKIDGKSPEGFLKDKASSMIWGWVIGAVIIGILVLGGIGLAGYIYFAAKSGSAGVSTGAATKWDGKSTLECSKVKMTGGSIKATTNSVVASAAAKVDCTGTTVTGKSKASGAAKVTGAN